MGEEHAQRSESLAWVLGMDVVLQKPKQNAGPPLFQKFSKTIQKSGGAKLSPTPAVGNAAKGL